MSSSVGDALFAGSLRVCEQTFVNSKKKDDLRKQSLESSRVSIYSTVPSRSARLQKGQQSRLSKSAATSRSVNMCEMIWYSFSSVLVDRGSFRGHYYTTRGHASCLPSISWGLQTKKTAALCQSMKSKPRTPTLSMINRNQQTLTRSTLELMPRFSHSASSFQGSSSSTSSRSSLVHRFDSTCPNLVAGYRSYPRISIRLRHCFSRREPSRQRVCAGQYPRRQGKTACGCRGLRVSWPGNRM